MFLKYFSWNMIAHCSGKGNKQILSIPKLTFLNNNKRKFPRTKKKEEQGKIIGKRETDRQRKRGK